MKIAEYNAVIDANINRACEGLRVIEEYCRFIISDKELSSKLATIRHNIAQVFKNIEEQLQIRDTNKDSRAKQMPPNRENIVELLTANFKRVTEALRVLEEYTGNSKMIEWRYECYELEKIIVLRACKKKITKGIYVISSNPDDLLDAATKGACMLQLRSKNESKEVILNKARFIKNKLLLYDIPFIINDFLDIALLIDADGIHTGQDDLCVSEIRKVIGEHKIVGKTSHTLEQGLKAMEKGADYISVGPLWETPSKPNRPGIGLDYLKKAKSEIKIPYVAIGGIDSKNIAEVMLYEPPMIGSIRNYDSLLEFIHKNC